MLLIKIFFFSHFSYIQSFKFTLCYAIAIAMLFFITNHHLNPSNVRIFPCSITTLKGHLLPQKSHTTRVVHWHPEKGKRHQERHDTHFPPRFPLHKTQIDTIYKTYFSRREEGGRKKGHSSCRHPLEKTNQGGSFWLLMFFNLPPHPHSMWTELIFGNIWSGGFSRGVGGGGTESMKIGDGNSHFRDR